MTRLPWSLFIFIYLFMYFLFSSYSVNLMMMFGEDKTLTGLDNRSQKER